MLERSCDERTICNKRSAVKADRQVGFIASMNLGQLVKIGVAFIVITTCQKILPLIRDSILHSHMSKNSPAFTT